MSGPETVRRVGPVRAEFWCFLEFFALAGIAVAQPTFELLGENARLFIAWRSSGIDLVAMAILVVVLPPLASWIVEVGIGLVVPRVRPIVHVVLLCGWAGLIGLEAFKRHSALAPMVLVALGIGTGIVAAVLIARFAMVRTWLHFLGLAPPAFLMMFLVASPAYDVALAAEPAVVDVRVGAPTRVVMIVLDELPIESLLDGQGRVDAELFPNFAALAGTSNWYRNSTTVAPNTEAAVPALLTGRQPTDPEAAPVGQVHPRNLFTLLANEYSLNVHEFITRLCPTSRCPLTRRAVGVHQGFVGMLSDVASIWADIATPERAPAQFGGLGSEDFSAFTTGSQFVGSIAAADGPRLDFLHVLLPHFPWHYTAGGQDYAAFPSLPAGLAGGRWTSVDAARTGRIRHLLQVQAVDTLLGQIVARLKAVDAFEDSLIVVTADHGVAFEAGKPFRGVAASTYPSIMWTPLFIKAAHQRAGVVDDRPARSVDVLPTIADHLDVDLPWPVSGRSLLGPPRRPGSVPLMRWKSNVVEPTNGSASLRFDGPTGFASVLRRPGAATGRSDLRLYRSGPYGALVGERAWPLVVPGDAGSVTLDDPLRYQVVDHTQPRTPWATVHGTIGAAARGRPIVVAFNGVIAGVATTGDVIEDGRLEYWAMVAPTLLRDGANLVQIFVVDGPRDAPRLRAAAITAG